MQSASSLEDLMDKWEAELKLVGLGTPSVIPFLDLSVYDMRNAALSIDCPYCRAHMLLEADEISTVLAKLRADGNTVHSHGLLERAHALLTSFRIIVNVLLGGLRRAGLL
ncbi:MAG: hypothetical protein OK449_06655 [Thaumarchaeota archaeon]|nr:hypothetical protein [Nitrososphaerota archaeon]